MMCHESRSLAAHTNPTSLLPRPAADVANTGTLKISLNLAHNKLYSQTSLCTGMMIKYMCIGIVPYKHCLCVTYHQVYFIVY